MRYFLIILFGSSLGLISETTAQDPTGLSEQEKKHIDDYLNNKTQNKSALSSRPFEIPGKLSFNGFIQSEWEDADNLGSDGSRITSTPFDSSTKTDRITEANTFANLGVEWNIENSTIYLAVEMGEYAAGLTGSSGQLGADASDIEVKNLYIEHDFNNGWAISAGIQGITADPRGLVMDDDQTAFTTSYVFSDTTKILGYIAETDTGTTRRITDDQQFYGFNLELQRENWICTPFWIHLKDRTDANQDSLIDFLGLHNILRVGPWTIEAQGIYNQGRILSTGALSNLSTSIRGHLTDLKLTRDFNGGVLSNLSLEWLHTSGGRPKTASQTTNGQQFHFQSQDPQVAYLLNIADSDGSDDAPGTSKLANINLALPEGINIIVLEANMEFSEKLTGYVRGGYLTTDVGNPETGTGVRFLGREINLGAAYQISKYLNFRMDYGHFHTGAYFSPHSDAHLFTSALRFEF